MLLRDVSLTSEVPQVGVSQLGLQRLVLRAPYRLSQLLSDNIRRGWHRKLVRQRMTKRCALPSGFFKLR